MAFGWTRTKFGLVEMKDATPAGLSTAMSKIDADCGSGASNQGTTTIASGSNGQTLPFATINVAATTDFAPGGVALVTTANGPQVVNYTGITATTLTGCTGGTGAMATGGTVVAQLQGVTMEATYETDRTSLTGADTTLAMNCTPQGAAPQTVANPGI